MGPQLHPRPRRSLAARGAGAHSGSSSSVVGSRWLRGTSVALAAPSRATRRRRRRRLQRSGSRTRARQSHSLPTTPLGPRLSGRPRSSRLRERGREAENHVSQSRRRPRRRAFGPPPRSRARADARVDQGLGITPGPRRTARTPARRASRARVATWCTASPGGARARSSAPASRARAGLWKRRTVCGLANESKRKPGAAPIPVGAAGGQLPLEGRAVRRARPP